ncbi:putative nucleotide-binding alpha-beta plait domain superfamily [Helianthus anomalus]
MFLLPFICFLSLSGNTKRMTAIQADWGFGFVTFAEDGVADRVSRRSHEICGQQVVLIFKRKKLEWFGTMKMLTKILGRNRLSNCWTILKTYCLTRLLW